MFGTRLNIVILMGDVDAVIWFEARCWNLWTWCLLKSLMYMWLRVRRWLRVVVRGIMVLDVPRLTPMRVRGRVLRRLLSAGMGLALLTWVLCMVL